MIEIELKIIPIGEETYKRLIYIPNLNDITLEQADDLFNNEYNYIIQEEVDNSKYGALDNWYVTNIKNDATLGFESFKKWYFNLNKFKKYKQLENKELFSNCWINLNGECINAVSSHYYYASDEVRRLSLYDRDIFFDATLVLESLGYVRCQSWNRKDNNLLFFTDKKPNSKQWLTIIRICNKFNSKIPNL